MLLARLRAGLSGASLSGGESLPLLTARQALELATLGGASVLNRDDIGSLEPGKCADFIAIKLDKLEYTGALSDPVAALVFCSPVTVDYSYVGGKAVVEQGHLVNLDLPAHIQTHNRIAAELLNH
jgi:8-oxoguanine deaminase